MNVHLGTNWFLTVVLILAAVNAIGYLGHRLLGRRYLIQSRRDHRDVLGHVAGITGVINAVLFALIVFVAWTYYDRARDAVDQETSLIWQIWHDVETADPTNPRSEELIPEGLHESIVDQLIAYVHEVADNEWPAMATGTWQNREVYHRQFDTGGLQLRSAYEHVIAAGFRDTSRTSWRNSAQRVLIQEIVARFNQLFEVRSRRIALSSEGAIPFIVWLVLMGGGLLCISCCWLIGFEDFELHAVITSLVASSFGLILFLILSLNTPFSGVIAISNERFVLLGKDIDHWEAQEKIEEDRHRER